MKKFFFLLLTVAGLDSFAQNTLPASGNVGVATLSPSTALQIGDFGGGVPNNQLLIPGVYNFEQVRLGQISNGNAALEFLNHSGAGASYGIKFLVDTDHGAPGLQIQYASPASTYATLNYQTGLYLTPFGKLGIGTTNPDEKLSVAGTIHAYKVKVNTGWADYVFKPSYKLASLSSVKAYIDQNHHLPDIPSEQEIVKNGADLGEMVKLQMKKIEELTLYLIEKDKELKQQQQESRRQALKLRKLEQKIKSVKN